MVNKKGLKTYLPLFLSLIFGLVLFFVVDDFVIDVLVIPFLWMVWFLSLLVRSIPQGIFWVVFVLFMFVLTLSYIRKRRVKEARTTRRLTRKLGKVEKWARLLESAKTYPYSKWRLSQQLRRLTQRVLSPLHEYDRLGKPASDLQLPPPIKTYFEAEQPYGFSIMKRLGSRSTNTSKDLDLNPEEVIRFIESRIERDQLGL